MKRPIDIKHRFKPTITRDAGKLAFPRPGGSIERVLYDGETPEYKKKQRELENLGRKIYRLNPAIGPGQTFKDLAGRTYRIEKDGSHRRVKE